MKLPFPIFRHIQEPAKVVVKVEEEVRMGTMYIFLLVTATILSVFGIITSNTPVVIGSMIIAPLSWPILGIAVGVASEKMSILLKSIVNVVLSCVLVIGLSYILSVGFLSSSLSLNSDILSMITPTLYDLIIALAVGFVGAVAVSWPKISETVAGVAIASSLLPPLSVTGMGFAMQNWEVVSGSFLLFITNMTSIIFSGLVLFLLQGYYRVSKEAHVGIITVSFGITVITILALGSQLTLSLSSLVQERSLVLASEKLLQTELSRISPDLLLDQSHIRKEQTASGAIMNIQANVTAPQDVAITSQEKNVLIDKLRETVGLPIQLDLRFIPSLTVLSEEALYRNKAQSHLALIEQQVRSYFNVISPDITVDTVRTVLGGAEDKAKITITLKVPDTISIGMEQTLQVQRALLEVVGKESDVEIQVVKVYEITAERTPSEFELVKESLQKVTGDFMVRVSVAWDMKIEIINLTRNAEGYTLYILVYTGNDANIPDKLAFYKKTLLEQVASLTETTFEIRSQIVNTSVLEL